MASAASPLKWEDVGLLIGSISIRESKSLAGRRTVPLSDYCKAELVQWRNLLGPEFSYYIFPNLKRPSTHVGSVKKSWARTLKVTGIEFSPIYNLRATFASRLSAAGESDLFVAQMMGHSSTSILPTYAKVIGDYRRDAIRKLEAFRQCHSQFVTPPGAEAGQAKISPNIPHLSSPESIN